jgi:hypothetical protein
MKKIYIIIPAIILVAVCFTSLAIDYDTKQSAIKMAEHVEFVKEKEIREAEASGESKCSDNIKVKLGDNVFEIPKKHSPYIENGYNNTIPNACEESNEPITASLVVIRKLGKQELNVPAGVWIYLSKYTKENYISPYKKISEKKENWILGGSGFYETDGELFGEKFFISNDPDFVTPSDEPFVLKCEPSMSNEIDKNLICSTSFLLNNAIVGIRQVSGSIELADWKKQLYPDALKYAKSLNK